MKNDIVDEVVLDLRRSSARAYSNKEWTLAEDLSGLAGRVERGEFIR